MDKNTEMRDQIFSLEAELARARALAEAKGLSPDQDHDHVDIFMRLASLRHMQHADRMIGRPTR